MDHFDFLGKWLCRLGLIGVVKIVQLFRVKLLVKCDRIMSFQSYTVGFYQREFEQMLLQLSSLLFIRSPLKLCLIGLLA